MELTFNEACQEFLEYEKRNLKFQSFNQCKKNFKLHIIPFFKNKKIKEISKKDILAWQNYIQNKGLSNNTNSQIKTKLDQLYDFLVMYYDVTQNISRIIPNFKKNRIPLNNNIWTMKEFRKFIKVSKNDIEYHTLFYFLFFTGVRLGEALALTWNDFEQKKVIIHKSLSQVYSDGKRIIQTTKNNQDRIKDLDFFTRYKLKRLRAYYIKNFSDFNNNFYVFGGKTPLACTTIRRKKNKYCKLARVKQIRIHDFRHSRGSLVYQKTHNIKIVQEELGHIDSKVTINTYIHAYDNDKKRAALLLNLLHLKIF